MQEIRMEEAAMNAKDDVAFLRDEIVRLGPWHLEVQVTPEVSTRVWTEAQSRVPGSPADNLAFMDPRPDLEAQLRRIYPDGLAGRSLLDCACNCGGYSFHAKELGAGECFGFDVREHWIRQAHFLLQNRTVGPTDAMRFEVCDLYDLPEMRLQPFDITLFMGIFYHLPDPISGLKIAADLTRELIVVNTTTRSGLPDGLLSIERESRELVLSGVYGLNWLPSGPDVIAQALKWAGFVDTHLVWWQREVNPGRGRLEMLASKKQGLLDVFRKAQV
jgi:tRNA (mo5U34)-methyltransferase